MIWRRFTVHLLTALGMLSGTGATMAEEELGRLFFTPEKRELLDRQRTLNTLESQPIAEDPQIIVNGQVRRSSGKRTTWINGQAQNEIETRTGVIAHPTAQGHEQVIIQSGEDPKAKVRVGETLNRGTQETRDLIGEGNIVIRKAPAGATR